MDDSRTLHGRHFVPAASRNSAGKARPAGRCRPHTQFCAADSPTAGSPATEALYELRLRLLRHWRRLRRRALRPNRGWPRRSRRHRRGAALGRHLRQRGLRAQEDPRARLGVWPPCRGCARLWLDRLAGGAERLGGADERHAPRGRAAQRHLPPAAGRGRPSSASRRTPSSSTRTRCCFGTGRAGSAGSRLRAW